MQKKTVIVTFFISLPIILFALTMILPTYDDWTYITSPYFGNIFTSGRMLPWNGYWRPFDALIGGILGLNHHLFPTLNHCIILLGHVISTILVYRLANKNILPAVFFFLSPGMICTVLDIDSANQVYATCWGLASLILYLQHHRWLWIACVIIATLCKENGIMYAFIPPFIGYMQQSSGKRVMDYIKDLCPMVATIAVYGLLRILLASADNGINDNYVTATLSDHVKDTLQYIIFAWIPMDYEAILYPPTRNIPLAVFTLIISLPFLFLVGKGLWERRRERMTYALIAAFFIAGAPHLLTIVSMMHIYAGLPFAALIINQAWKNKEKIYMTAALMFLMAAIITDLHHWHAAYESGIVGKEMAEQVIEKSRTKPQKVFVINFDNGEKKYSCINVIPRDAFGWGHAANYYSDYTMANEINDTNVVAPSDDMAKQKMIEHIAKEAETHFQYDALWVVDGKDVSIYYEKQR